MEAPWWDETEEERLQRLEREPHLATTADVEITGVDPVAEQEYERTHCSMCQERLPAWAEGGGLCPECDEDASACYGTSRYDED